MEFSLEGVEHQVKGNSLVPIGGKLPFYREVRTAQLLDFLLTLFIRPDKNLRSRVNKWLYSRTRPGFYLEIKPNLHLAYADQRDGHGTQHWWRLFFDEQWKEMVERAVRGTALAVAGQNGHDSNGRSTSAGQANASREWGGMYFRSLAEIKIAEALDACNVLFFANARGRIGRQRSPVAESSGWLTGRLEVDFLIFSKGRCMVLEVDGRHHNEGTQTLRDYVKDRVLLREGIPTARFTADECLSQPEQVVTEFLNLLSRFYDRCCCQNQL